MNAETHHTPTGVAEQPQFVTDAVDHLDKALRICCDSWDRGDTMVILPGNLSILLGNGIAALFKKILVEKTGSPLDLIPMETSDGSHTLIRMPKNNMVSPQVQSDVRFFKTSSSNGDTVDLVAATAAVVKKAPRPMNCWIIFRDSMARGLKIKFPELTVQETSSRCSEIWHSLTPHEKAPWQAAAQSAKEEHLRQHPDYKYSPRKPGEKKKRQSRKAKRASAIANVPEVLNLELAPDIATSSANLTYDTALPVNDITADIGNAFIDEFTQFFEPATMLDMFTQESVSAEPTYNSESFRHARLDVEFGLDFEMNTTFALLDDDAFAFRDGADGDAILPAFFQDTY